MRMFTIRSKWHFMVQNCSDSISEDSRDPSICVPLVLTSDRPIPPAGKWTVHLKHKSALSVCLLMKTLHLYIVLRHVSYRTVITNKSRRGETMQQWCIPAQPISRENMLHQLSM